MHRYPLGAVLVLVSVANAAADEKATQKTAPILCRGHYHSEQEAIQQLARMAATYSNRGAWEQRAAKVRKQILVGAKLHPLPQRTPLNPILRKKRAHDGYSVESAAFEARPGFYVYGSLYRPLGKQGPFPAVLCLSP